MAVTPAAKQRAAAGAAASAWTDKDMALSPENPAGGKAMGNAGDYRQPNRQLDDGPGKTM